MAKVYVFSRKTEYFPLKIVKSFEEDIINKKRGLSPLILFDFIDNITFKTPFSITRLVILIF